MPCEAMISARLCAAQPSARSPRTAEQAAAFGSVLQAESGGVLCAHEEGVPASNAITPTSTDQASARIIGSLPRSPVQSTGVAASMGVFRAVAKANTGRTYLTKRRRILCVD